MTERDGERDGLSYAAWCILLVAAFGVSSGTVAVFVEGGFGGDLEELRERRQRLLEVRQRNRGRYRSLRRREVRLHHDPYLIEKLARERLGLSRPGEKRVVFDSEGTPDSAALRSGSEGGVR